MNRAEIYARATAKLAERRSALPTRLHAWLLTRSRGRVASRMFGTPLLVLRTVGRKSGRVRQTPVLYLEHDSGFAVVASNSGSRRPPSWWLNLQHQSECEAFISGRWQTLAARQASESEAAELWPRLDAAYAGYRHYREVSPRTLAVVILERVERQEA